MFSKSTMFSARTLRSAVSGKKHFCGMTTPSGRRAASSWNNDRCQKQQLLLLQQQRQPQRSFAWSAPSSAASEVPLSPYEYPNRTEAPEITQTKAKDVLGKGQDQAQNSEGSVLLSSPSSTANKTTKLYDPLDPFDDQGMMNDAEREQRKQEFHQLFLLQQQEHPSTSSSSSFSSPSVFSNTHNNGGSRLVPITTTIPDFVPPNVPSDQLQTPETLITVLDNGIRVVSQETYGQMSTVGVLNNVGSRHETAQGTLHLLETMAFGSTKHLEGLQISEWLQDWGATRFVSHGREQTLFCIDILRPNVEKAMTLLSEVVLEPRIVDVNVEDFNMALDTMAFQAQEQLPQLVLAEALQRAAYGADQQLGKFHFATLDSIQQQLLSPPIVQEFYDTAIRHNPQQMVVVGAGIAHESLVDLAKESFGHMTQQQAPITIPSIYRGGYHAIPSNPTSVSIFNPTVVPTEQYCHVALAFPVGGWHDSHSMVTACVTQMLLGGGSSFSAGGPGKGMYSRLYQTVLNKYSFLESAEAFTTFAEEGGLLGVTASTSHAKEIPFMMAILTKQLLQLATHRVSEVELSRARNMLKCNVLTQLESRLVLFEDMGRQILTYGHREDAATTCARIDSVSAQDIQELVQNMIRSTNPTMAATGYHLDQVPRHEEVKGWIERSL